MRNEEVREVVLSVRRTSSRKLQVEISSILKICNVYKDSGYRAGPISTTRLHLLPDFYLWPINLVISEGSHSEG